MSDVVDRFDELAGRFRLGKEAAQAARKQGAREADPLYAEAEALRARMRRMGTPCSLEQARVIIEERTNSSEQE